MTKVHLERCEALLYAAPFREPYVTSVGTITSREMLLVRLRAEGLEGIGEIAPMSLRGGPGADALLDEVREALDELEGRPVPTAGIDSVGRALAELRTHLAPTAYAAIEVALLDLASQVAEMPLWMWLGASSPEPIQCNATLPMAEPERLEALAADLASEGFVEFKLKVGSPDDREMVIGAMAGAGDDGVLRLDANGAWGPQQAVDSIMAIAEACPRLDLVEQPTAEARGLAFVKASTPVRVAADESLVSPTDANRLVAAEACDAGTAKLSKVGGVRAAIAIAELIPTYYSSALEGPLGIAAAAHAAFASKSAGLRHGLASDELYADSIADGSLRNGPRIEPPQRSGIGVGVDEAALARLRSDSGAPG